MKSAEHMVYMIDNLTTANENKITNEINSIVSKDGLTFTRKDYNDFKKQLMRHWAKYQRKFRTNASKIITKLFLETHGRDPIY